MSTAERTAVRAGGTPGRAVSGIAVALGCVLFLGGFAWAALLYRPYAVPTDSMEPTVAAGDRVLAQRVDGGEVRRGDVVVFTDPAWGDLPMVKRVVGTGGDTVACCDRQGRLTVNGEPIEEPYLRGSGSGSVRGAADSPAPPASPTEFTAAVPENGVFLLGDARGSSLDSREHLTDGGQGSVPVSAISSRVDAVVWPAGSAGRLARPAAFAALPGGVSAPGPLFPLALAVGGGAGLVLAGAAYGPLAGQLARRRAEAARA
ncbi:signal peptidase I [Streptomyces zingiberis]|uniref:Signal peptidase I n=1 Tax=Streptomyces zingiberis TaxID=2053010 RepID=A0ABX1BXB0_9ACTN|nr:signal peptidase I [Streptomyces zingiberis]NJQ02295.1 signal peptidase I [Streptomyces zingiberis]